eukprot:TRINITY_DN109709_c0_g1_i1.p1 TRINITY_DN109709_c0_g1~~TRINITY_DN109709_c0_g1_i1.p1  ORF type:complete len:179 (-),score=7.57 TRINITY_DN109709_c0_g1_i1:58-558(-)
MPRPTPVDHGRTFGRTMAQNWEQRIGKEERVFLREEPQFVRERRRPLASAISMASLSEDLRGIQSLNLCDRLMMQARHDRRAHASSTHLRFVSQEEPAHWVPGAQRIVTHRPQFVTVANEDSQSLSAPKVEIWRRPPAGMASSRLAVASAPRMTYDPPELAGCLVI